MSGPRDRFWRTARFAGQKLQDSGIRHCLIKTYGGDPEYADGNLDVVVDGELRDVYQAVFAPRFLLSDRDFYKHRWYERNKLMLYPTSDQHVHLHLHSEVGWHDACFVPARNVLRGRRAVSPSSKPVQVASGEMEARILLLHGLVEKYGFSRRDRDFIAEKHVEALCRDYGLDRERIIRSLERVESLSARDLAHVLPKLWKAAGYGPRNVVLHLLHLLLTAIRQLSGGRGRSSPPEG